MNLLEQITRRDALGVKLHKLILGERMLMLEDTGQMKLVKFRIKL